MTTASGTVSLKWIGINLMAGIDSRGNPLVIGDSAGNDPKWSALKLFDQ